MIRASIYGRLGAYPVERETRNGKPMTTGSIAVNAGRPDADEQTVWFSLAAFGRTAQELARHRKGDLAGVIGTLYRTRFTGRGGQERENWSLTVDSIVSARVVRPAGGRKRAQNDDTAAATVPAAPSDDGTPFNDPLPF